MASSRTLLNKDPNYKKKPFKKTGAPSKMDKALVAQVVSVEAQTMPVSTEQITALTKVLSRSRASIKKMVEEAREEFVESARSLLNRLANMFKSTKRPPSRP